ncbi:MAG TPA: molybdopterin biosynthesis protein [Anaerolineaceae bacterium]|nr:molybdopterin biosynthesis protein [Anaerolineaceae bacterium]
MPFNYLTNTPLDEAVEQYLKILLEHGLHYKTEVILTQDALGRVSANAVYAKISAPHFNACGMDGIALDSRKTFGATETTPVRLRESDFVWVDTGDPLPAGCDAVVMVEDVVEEGEFYVLYAAAVPWQNIRQIGEDISAGDMIIPSYTLITPSCMGAMLAAGVLQVEVVKRPIIGIIPTGDEIVAPTENPGEGDIVEFNSTIFSGMLTEWGCIPRVFPIVRDDADLIQNALADAVNECDGVMINAGSSAGREDYTKDAIQKIGTVILHGIAIKPGKPAVLAMVVRENPSYCIPVIGVPGYPVSGIMIMEMVFKTIIEKLTCRTFERAETIEALVSRRLTSSLKYREFIRARLGWVNGKMIAVPLNRGAGVVSSFVKADGIIDVPQNLEGYEAGEKVNVHLLRDLEEIKRTLVISGSHDPLLDEVTDIMQRDFPGCTIASSHVGSMGGIMAVKRGEAHLGGTHLLDEETGIYNIPYVKRYFPDGGVVLMECVGRVQGLMVARGNPKGIKGFSDLVDLSYVNRQKGSGTRVLCDFLAKQNGVDTSLIHGYEREEFTHTAVAAAIAAGTADAGLGILAAARIYGLDFIPIAEEEYDLLIAADAYETEAVGRLIIIIKGKEFARRLNALGGYILKNPGRIKRWN